ncbi:hypothetical protein [Brevundimonas sp.]|uniref:hypothetical protein n=1 Tax=Brevundimonas sp. TaxID=1871086 RepID=UPI002899BF45|nr:hypothetical protein [Brevundimonas sp.]
MHFEALCLDYDRRLQCFMLNARVDYEWYLQHTDGSEENLSIQRDIVKGTKSYETLRHDIRRGCVLPPIVLSARDVDVSKYTSYDTSVGTIQASLEDLLGIKTSVKDISPEQVDIIDGLQRTNALRQTLEAISEDTEKAYFLSRSLRLEIWLNIPFYTLAYRMLLLNAGQKPMSMKHQIDILSKGLFDDLSSIQDIDIIKVKDRRRRVRPGQYHLSTLSQVFQSWLQRNPNVDLRNLVVEQLLVDEAIESLGIDLRHSNHQNSRDDFRQFIEWLVKFDQHLGPDNAKFLSQDTVLLGIAAAVGFAHKESTYRARYTDASNRLLICDMNEIGLDQFDTIRAAIDPKRNNVGEATRQLVFYTFREFIMQSGLIPLSECWTQGAQIAIR